MVTQDQVAATIPTAVVPTAIVPREATLGSRLSDDDPLYRYPLTRAAIDEYDTKYGPVKQAAAILRNSGNADLADLVEQEANIEYTPIMTEAMAMGRLLREWKDRR